MKIDLKVERPYYELMYYNLVSKILVGTCCMDIHKNILYNLSSEWVIILSVNYIILKLSLLLSFILMHIW